MITPAQAIETARQQGWCKISQHVYLWLTEEAQKHIRLDDINTPFLLITESQGFEDPVKVRNESNKKLIEVCG